MKKVSFEEERRGYSKEQVDKYITLLQDALEEMEEESGKKDIELETRRKEATESSLKIQASEEKLLSQEMEHRGTCQILQDKVDRLEQEAKDKRKEMEDFRKSKETKIANQTKEIQELICQVNALQERSKEQTAGNGQGNTAAEKMLSDLKREREHLLNEKQALTAEVENLNKKLKEKAEADHGKVNADGIEELFVQAKASADAYVKKVQAQVQAERSEIIKENEQLVEAAKLEAEKIVAEARAEKQTELDQKLSEFARIEAEKRAEMTEILQNAKDELESAKAEAEGIRNQSRIILEQAEKRKEKILSRAQEKAQLLAVPIKEQCEGLRKEMEDTAERFAEFYRCLKEPMDGKDTTHSL